MLILTLFSDFGEKKNKEKGGIVKSAGKWINSTNEISINSIYIKR